MTTVPPPARAATALVLARRWAALGTVGDEGPLVSHVAYAPEADLGGVLLFLSGLSAHTRHLLADPRASLGVSEDDDGSGDPQSLVRVSLEGSVELVGRETEGFDSAWRVYRHRFPPAARLLPLADFGLFRFRIDTARYVGGFARAATLSSEQLRRAAGA